MNPGQPLAQTGQGAVSRALVQTVLDTLRDSRLPDARHLAERLADPAAVPDMAQLERLLDACAQEQGPDCGLAMGARARPATFSALGYLAMSSRTLGEAVAQMPAYESVVMDTGLTTLRRDGDRVWLGWLLRDRPPHPVLEDFILAAWLNLGRWLVGRNLSPDEVRFSHPAPADAAPYEHTFGCRLAFSCPEAGVSFPAAWLDFPVLHADPDLHALMRERAQALQAAQPVTGTWSRQVLALLPDLLPRQEATLAAVAERLGLGERSLRRRLAEEGTGFGELLQEQRRQLARHYLRDSRLGLLDIALLLGYAEHSAFSTAFRQWYGVTPQQYRGGR
jgi:AraC-like DNA-binding protein